MNGNKKRFPLPVLITGCFCVVFLIVCGPCILDKQHVKQQEKLYEQMSENSGFTKEGIAYAYESEDADSRAEQEDISGTVIAPEGIEINFAEIKELNDDVYAWLYVPGTGICYPVVQSGEKEPEDYYLNHNIDKSEGYPGCVYSQKRNSKDFSDPDTVLYGHNMNDGTMFAALHAYKDKDYFTKHNEAYIYTEDQVMKYRLWAALATDDRLILDYYDDFNDVYVFQKYITDISGMAALGSAYSDADVVVNAGDNLLTLSTCEEDDNSRRFLVIFELEEILGVVPESEETTSM